jgi:hypothetical protein
VAEIFLQKIMHRTPKREIELAAVSAICARGVLFFINAPLLWPTKVYIHSSGERQKAPKERERERE